MEKERRGDVDSRQLRVERKSGEKDNAETQSALSRAEKA
jgi:hypothetical protein